MATESLRSTLSLPALGGVGSPSRRIDHLGCPTKSSHSRYKYARTFMLKRHAPRLPPLTHSQSFATLH